MVRKRRDSLLDILSQLFIAVPWWLGLIATVLVFVLFRSAVTPLLTKLLSQSSGDPTRESVFSTVTPFLTGFFPLAAPWIAGLVGLVWIGSLYGKLLRRNLLRHGSTIKAIRRYSWQEFELLITEYFRRQGFSVEERGGSSPDGGIDIIVRKGGQTYLVQCKHWRAHKVGVKYIRELLGVVTAQKAQGGIFVTTGIFTPDAIDFAQTNTIQLIDAERLVPMIRAVQGESQQAPSIPTRLQANPPAAKSELHPQVHETRGAPACPKCGIPMVLRTASKGSNAGQQFCGCANFPKCREIRQLP